MSFFMNGTSLILRLMERPDRDHRRVTTAAGLRIWAAPDKYY
jgi:hypothetical protein